MKVSNSLANIQDWMLRVFEVMLKCEPLSCASPTLQVARLPACMSASLWVASRTICKLCVASQGFNLLWAATRPVWVASYEPISARDVSHVSLHIVSSPRIWLLKNIEILYLFRNEGKSFRVVKIFSSSFGRT